MPHTAITSRQALAAGVASYAVWGLFPLFFAALQPAQPMEILAERIVWSFVFALGMLVVLRTPWAWAALLRRRKHALTMLAASVLIGANWLTFIWAVNSGYVVEASLGYFVNPLVNVAFGVLLFGERLTRGAKIGGALALLGVGVIAFDHWQTLWVSGVLALSFGLYGVTKKKTHLPAMPGLLVEATVLLPAALIYLAWLHQAGSAAMGTGVSVSVLLILSGPVTVIPLWLFAIAAPRLPYGVVGMLQYLAPSIQFILGLTVFGEHVSVSYWAGLVFVWIGSAIYLDRTLRATRQAEPQPA